MLFDPSSPLKSMVLKLDPFFKSLIKCAPTQYTIMALIPFLLVEKKSDGLQLKN